MAILLGETDDILKDLGFNTKIKFQQLSVVFDVDYVDTNYLVLIFGSSLKLEDVKRPPNVRVPNINDVQHVTLAMVDLDLPSRQKPSARVGKFWF